MTILLKSNIEFKSRTLLLENKIYELNCYFDENGRTKTKMFSCKEQNGKKKREEKVITNEIAEVVVVKNGLP